MNPRPLPLQYGQKAGGHYPPTGAFVNTAVSPRTHVPGRVGLRGEAGETSG